MRAGRREKSEVRGKREGGGESGEGEGVDFDRGHWESKGRNEGRRKEDKGQAVRQTDI